MGSYFLAKPEVAVAVDATKCTKGKDQESANNLEVNKVEDVKIEQAKEQKETIAEIIEDDFEVIPEDKPSKLSDECCQVEDVVEQIDNEIELETPIKEDMIPLDNQTATEISSQDKVELINFDKENNATIEKEISNPGAESFVNTTNPTIDNAEVNRCVEDVSKEHITLETDIAPENLEVLDIAEVCTVTDDEKMPVQDMELEQNIQDDSLQVFSEDPIQNNSSVGKDVESEEIIELISEVISEKVDVIEEISSNNHESKVLLTNTETSTIDAVIPEEISNIVEPIEDTFDDTANTGPMSDVENITENIKAEVVEVIGSIEEDQQQPLDEPLKELDTDEPTKEPKENQDIKVEEADITIDIKEEPVEEFSSKQEIEDDFSKAMDDCKMQVENIQNSINGLGKESEGKPTEEKQDDVCCCPHPEMDNQEISKTDEDVCHCPHPELSAENCKGQNCLTITEANTTFIVDESGKTMNQLVYNLSEEKDGYDVMKESSPELQDKDLCNKCSCDSELLTENVEEVPNTSRSALNIESDIHISKHAETKDKSEEEQPREEGNSETEAKEYTASSDDVPEVEMIGSIQDCETLYPKLGDEKEEINQAPESENEVIPFNDVRKENTTPLEVQNCVENVCESKTTISVKDADLKDEEEPKEQELETIELTSAVEYVIKESTGNSVTLDDE